ncbi:MAG: hypothetical protein E7471_05470 [Ruminococcaceae bacterium]|nr:hypothetical protein [Oscillospiraceae bacterium]
MKKILFMLLSVAMLLAFAACNSSAPVEDEKIDEPIVEEQQDIDAPQDDVIGEPQPEVEEEKDNVVSDPPAKPEVKPEEKPITPAPEVKPEEKPAEKPVEQPQSNTPANVILSDFKAKVNGTTDLEALAGELMKNPIIQFMPASMAVEPGFLNGFKSEINGFSKGVMFGPAIGTIPFIGYLFEVDGDVNAFISTLKENADLRWNICTSADEMVVASVGNKVCFVMAPSAFEE